MEYSIIYSFDVPRDVPVSRCNPPKRQLRRLWQLTEGDEQYEYNYLGGEWDRGKHRKWCAILNQEQFEDFLSHCGLRAEDVQTMGSLGAPGCGLGVAPAISFRAEDEYSIAGAYVTPLGDVKEALTFLRDNGIEDCEVPLVFKDAKGQQHLLGEETLEEDKQQAGDWLWDNLRSVIIERYKDGV